MSTDKDKILPIYLADKIITTDLDAYVMGILNVTPNSFWNGSKILPKSTNEAIEKALEMVEAGCDIIDIGGEATNPGCDYVDADTELQRIIPVIEGIRKYSVCPISVDTRKSKVLTEALKFGVDILNDISAMEDDPKIVEVVSESKISVILMHKQGIPKNMQEAPKYQDCVNEVFEYLKNRGEFCIQNGIDSEKIIFDCGIGFGKNLQNNIDLIKATNRFTEILDKKHHVVMALSRKKCLRDITLRNVNECLASTISANLMAVKYGATILRVHDVGECVDMLKIYKELK